MFANPLKSIRILTHPCQFLRFLMNPCKNVRILTSLYEFFRIHEFTRICTKPYTHGNHNFDTLSMLSLGWDCEDFSLVGTFFRSAPSSLWSFELQFCGRVDAFVVIET